MDIFNKNKLSKLYSLIQRQDEEIQTQKILVSNLKNELIRDSNRIKSLLKDKEELFSQYKIEKSNNLKLTLDLSTLNNELEAKLESTKKEFNSLSTSYNEKIDYLNKELDSLSKTHEEKLRELNKNFEIDIHIAKLTKCKELPLKIEEDIRKIIEEKEIGFPWLAKAISEYYENLDYIYASYLERKKRPAFKSAAQIKQITKEKTLFKKEYIIMKYTLKYYESLFPWLSEYIGIDSDELIRQLQAEKTIEHDDEDPVSFYLHKGEYSKLSVTERNQKALDRYWSSKKSPWQIGRDYERYIGYLYEKEGYRVQYFGIEKGLEDLGRDLVCTKNGITEIVQCKYWSKAKNASIRENHINQLFGTTVKHYMDNIANNKTDLSSFLEDYSKGKIIGTIVTSTVLSETAIEFSKTLNINIKQEIDLNFKYPCIKCNINPSTKEKIYHLPFDQQYDKTRIDFKSGEFYALSVKEAEKKGFRRAYKWLGE